MLWSNSPEDTAVLAQRMATGLRPGDCLMLDGPISAGKSHFARALIQSVQTVPEAVPSPTFTLVQIYNTRLGEIWHADLYRLTVSDELLELGIWDAFETVICLIEWPDRLGPIAPQHALWLEFNIIGDATDCREITITGPAARWAALLDGVCT